MRLEGYVGRDYKMEIRGTSCMLYVYKHKDTSSTDDECGCAQYDDEQGDHGEHDTRGFTDLRTCKPPRDSHSHVWVVCREVLHIHSSPRLETTPRRDRDRSQEYYCMCLHLHAPYSGLTY